MSHLKTHRTTIFSSIPSFGIAASLAICSIFSSGCATIQLPGYRLEDCSAETCTTSPTLLPPMPMPGWLARWKAEKDLPSPPAAPRFHPVPTRPMFQPAPTAHLLHGAEQQICYGQLPEPQSWSPAMSSTMTPSPTPAPPQ